MSAITSEWAPAETEAPTARAGKRSREEEFSAALERYIANYQRHRAATDRSEASHAGAARPSFFQLLVGWPR